MIMKKRRTPTLELLEDRISPATHTVNTVSDTPVANQTTFRQALTAAIADTDAVVNINFDLGTGVQTIELSATLGKLPDITKLPGITREITIDALTGAPAGRTIVIDGKNFPRPQPEPMPGQPAPPPVVLVDGLTILASNCTIKGLTIRNFSGYGIVLGKDIGADNSIFANNNQILNCRIEENRGGGVRIISSDKNTIKDSFIIGSGTEITVSPQGGTFTSIYDDSDGVFSVEWQGGLPGGGVTPP